VIWRLPRKESLVTPPSRCTSCGMRLMPWDNVPILSWLVLGGCCRKCHEPISPRYPVVELMTAVLFVVMNAFIASPLTLVVSMAFGCAMIVVMFIDLDHRIIPDGITLPGTVLGLGMAFLGVLAGPREAFLGVLLGGGGLFAVAAGYRAATGRDGLGGGDIKLLAMVGAFLGPSGALLTILLGSVAGTLFACVYMLRTGAGRTAELPFGTFLAPAAVVALLTGARIVESYWGIFS
jgi:leader peptidase (prepilin peptidase)/N-methyltransferase